MQTVFVTGANGFIGSAICRKLVADSWQVRAGTRSCQGLSSLPTGSIPVLLSSLDQETDWSDALSGVKTVFHLAARVHITHETASDPLKEFRITNTEGTAQLARQASDAGVKRFIFMSTIGVNGYCSGNNPFTEKSLPAPYNPYSISKWEAEKRLAELAATTSMEIVVIRAPLVYGPGNPGNFLSLMQAVSKGIPLPLSSVSNCRSLIYIGNLVDALATCAVHSAAAGKTYLVSDGEDVSTPELIRRVAQTLGRPARLIPMPVMLLRALGAIAGKSPAIRRLADSLTVDISKIRNELGWTPPFSMDEGLKATADWYLKLDDRI